MRLWSPYSDVFDNVSLSNEDAVPGLSYIRFGKFLGRNVGACFAAKDADMFNIFPQACPSFFRDDG